MIILVLTKNNFSKNLRFWFGFKKVAKETLWGYFVTEKFTNQLLWKLLGTQKVSERMIMKLMVAPHSHYETVKNFSAKIMKVMVASKSCREVIAIIRFLFLVKTYFAQPRSLNFFFLHPIVFWVKPLKWCLFICCGDEDQKQHALADAFFFFLSTDASKTQIRNTFVVLVLEHEYLKVDLNSSGARNKHRQCVQPSSSKMLSTCVVLKLRS